MDSNIFDFRHLKNGPDIKMALQSSSPFVVGENPIPKGKVLFADKPDPLEAAFSYPYKTSENFTSVFNSVSHSDTSLNVNHTSTSHEDIKSSFQEMIDNNIMNDSGSSRSGSMEGEMDKESESDDAHDAHQKQNSLCETAAIPKVNSRLDMDVSENDFSDNEDLVECGNCDKEFQSLQEYMDHTCAANKSVENESMNVSKSPEKNSKDLSDVESFDGKIVYNPDGSAYIIEGDSDSDLDSIIDLPQKEGVIIDRRGATGETSKQLIPPINNAFFVPRNPNLLVNSMYVIPQKQQTPIMHSYRVYDLRSGKPNSQTSGESDAKNSTMSSSHSDLPSTSASSSLDLSSSHVTTVPTKPILMCFICKLSFGFAKSFTSHANTEHSMVLTAEENEIMSKKFSSAIIQGIGKDKDPLMSFLEPIKSSDDTSVKQPKLHNSKGVENESSTSPTISPCRENTSVSYIYTKPKLSETFKDNKNPSADVPKQQVESDSPTTAILNAMSHKTLNYDIAASSMISNRLENKKLKLDLKESEALPASSSPMQQRFMQEYYNFNSSIGSASKPYLPPLPSPLGHKSGFYGVCEEHPNGRAQGVECPNCDMILGSSQSLGGHMTMMHSRNSCKTLKCPKCNWHYKYQETLEIHMKEKHPDSDQKCMYCLTNQSHPRLARGESYSCGYKPYRCEVCNYSTTTKGNLSIHMQSDKHLNNVQELANGGGEMKLQQQLPPPPPPPQQHPPTPPITQSKTPPHQQLNQQQQQQAVSDSLQKNKQNKPKPTWRCDVCNYETNVARNLRIHMTSEKHTHNMMVLQQNMKHMQRDMQLHQLNQFAMLQQDPSFLGLAGPIPGGVTFPYDGSLVMGGIPPGFGEAPMDLTKENGIGPGPNGGENQPDVSRLYQCCVCNIYGTDSLESMHQHLQHDRTKQHEHDNIVISNGTYLCNLCQYKTNLKANFQLHCKTDKHLQRLQLLNHIKEGGDDNEWRLKYLNVSNPVQVRCNACDYYTNSIHKLQIHTGNPRHEASGQIFCHLQLQVAKFPTGADKYYQCSLCKFNARSKLGLMQHVHSMQHLHSESLKQLEMKETGQMEIDIGDIFVVKEIDDSDSVKFDDEHDEEGRWRILMLKIKKFDWSRLSSTQS